ncbi:MAG TPA: tRNA (adenosine(37)-N6)-threonylcarbamoyltransferase complex dimerization subunit type 1 TsaB [Clostridia bacterium]|nr:tRNA (adenosine(37)-N6)-threonylcarbamoyltransferase complex dimerization subunit type 1 TsaB [Clostridia bacterium]
MRVLAIESATNVAALAIVAEEAVIAEAVLNTGKTHSQRLMPMLARLLEEADLELEDLDGIVVSGGPGSFTGLRIGLATAKGLAYASGKPLVMVSTLDSLAYNLKGYPHLICPILNARRNEVYTAVYRDAGEELTLVMSYAALPPAELVQRLRPLAEPVMFLGDAVPVFGAYLQEQMGSLARQATIFASMPSAAVLGWLGLQKLKKGQVADLATAKPFYIRPSEAEVKWQQKNR